MDPAAELEEDQLIRLNELVFLENICEELPEDQQDRLRRAMLLMLYSHFEGFVKTALEIYRRHINESGSKCKDVRPEIATCALKDIFRAFRNPENAANFLPESLKNLGELRSLAIERTFIDQASNIGLREVLIPDKYIDMESNLKPIVLRKNLYRMGLPHDMFDDHEVIISQLLGRRNNIAHGAEALGVRIEVYQEMKTAVTEVMSDLRLKILGAIQNQSYLT